MLAARNCGVPTGTSCCWYMLVARNCGVPTGTSCYWYMLAARNCGVPTGTSFGNGFARKVLSVDVRALGHRI
jgi:hypothetical protein